MFTLGTKEGTQANRVRRYLDVKYMTLEYEAESDDSGHVIFKFPTLDEEEFRGLVFKLKRVDGVTLMGVDSELTESNIMKLANLIEIESDELDEINENLNPEVLRMLNRFIKSMAKRYDYSERDAVFAIKAAMKQRDFLDSEDEENQSIDRPDTDIQEQKIRKLIHNELKRIS